MFRAKFFLFLCVFSSCISHAKQQFWPVDVWNTPYGSDHTAIKSYYPTFGKYKTQYNICVSMPRNDNYWSFYIHGLKKQAAKYNLKLDIQNAGSFQNIEIQKTQLRRCAKKADAIIVASISYSILSNFYKEIAFDKPVIALAHDVIDLGIFSKTATNFELMGLNLGNYLKKLYNNKKNVKAIYLPGQINLNWIEVNEIGLKKALKNSNLEIIETRYGDLDINNQKKLVEAALHNNEDKIDLIIANSFAAQAAVNLLKEKNLNDKIKVAATFISPEIYQMLKNNKIIAAAYDLPMRQGQIAIEQVLKILNGKPIYKSVTPRIFILNPNNVSKYNIN